MRPEPIEQAQLDDKGITKRARRRPSSPAMIVVCSPSSFFRLGVRGAITPALCDDLVKDAATVPQAMSIATAMTLLLVDACYFSAAEMLRTVAIAAASGVRTMFLARPTKGCSVACADEVIEAGASVFILDDRPGVALVSAIEIVLHDGRQVLDARAVSKHDLERIQAGVANLAIVHPEMPPERCLTPRETQVIALASDGLSNADIALEMRISVQTVKTHMSEVLFKLGSHCRTQAVMIALARELIPLPVRSAPLRSASSRRRPEVIATSRGRRRPALRYMTGPPERRRLTGNKERRG